MNIWANGVVRPPFVNELLDTCHDLLRQCLQKEMSACVEHWSEEDPFHGTCVMCALIAQELFGGVLMRSPLDNLPKYSHMRSHYWNRLPCGVEVDLSASQFRGNDRDLVPAGELRTAEYVLSYPETRHRFTRLVIEWNGKNCVRGLGLEIDLIKFTSL